jgi:hypothetical protein
MTQRSLPNRGSAKNTQKQSDKLKLLLSLARALAARPAALRLSCIIIIYIKRRGAKKKFF